MGELFVEGPEAGAALAARARHRPADARRRARPVLDDLSRPTAAIIDDLIVYRLGDGAVPRRRQRRQRARSSATRSPSGSRASGASSTTGRSRRRSSPSRARAPSRSSAPLTDVDLDALRYYAIAEGTVAGIPALVARTGYTGEDGFEVFVETGRAAELWDALLAAGRADGLLAGRPRRARHAPPRGGHAALRQRARPRRRTRSRPVSAASSSSTSPATSSAGRRSRRSPRDGAARSASSGSSIARPRHRPPRLPGPRPATGATGVVTSGTQSPTLGRADRDGATSRPADAEPGTMLDVEIRDQRVPAEVVAAAVLPPGPLTRRRAARDRDPHAEGVRCRPAEEEEHAMVPADLRYTKDHEWVRVDGDEATVGITDYAADQLGDIVFVELPDVGRALEPVRRRSASSSRSRPSATCSRPLAGEVIAANDALAGDAGAREQRPVRRGLDDPRPARRRRPRSTSCSTPRPTTR